MEGTRRREKDKGSEGSRSFVPVCQRPARAGAGSGAGAGLPRWPSPVAHARPPPHPLHDPVRVASTTYTRTTTAAPRTYLCPPGIHPAHPGIYPLKQRIYNGAHAVALLFWRPLEAPNLPYPLDTQSAWGSTSHTKLQRV